MNNLFSSLLEKIQKEYKLKADNTEAIAALLTQELGIVIPASVIQVKRYTLYVQVSPTIKAAIVANKVRLLSKLQEYNIDTIR